MTDKIVYTYYSSEKEHLNKKLDVKSFKQLVEKKSKFCIKLTTDVFTCMINNEIVQYKLVFSTLSKDSVMRDNKRLNTKLSELENYDGYKIICNELGNMKYITVDIENSELELTEIPFWIKKCKAEKDFGLFAEDDCFICLLEIENEDKTIRFSCCDKHIHDQCYDLLNTNMKKKCGHCRSKLFDY